MGAVDDETLGEMLKAAFEAGRKMEQDIADKVFAKGAEVGASLLAKGSAAGDESRLAAALGGISALYQAQNALATVRGSSTVFTKIVRLGDGEHAGCGVCDDCKAKGKDAPRSN